MPTVQRKKPQQYTKTPDPFYHSKEWKSARRSHLMQNPLCFYSQLNGVIDAATLVDHFRPRRLFPELSLDPSNFRSSNDEMHNKKRVWERGIATREQFEKEIGNFIESLKA